MASLNVELHGELIGHLIGTSRRNFDFVADSAALKSMVWVVRFFRSRFLN
jgi:hypothetical protein